MGAGWGGLELRQVSTYFKLEAKFRPDYIELFRRFLLRILNPVKHEIVTRSGVSGHPNYPVERHGSGRLSKHYVITGQMC